MFGWCTDKIRGRNIYGIALQSYHGESELHITFFEKGAVIRNIKFVTREVWRGTFNGKTGFFVSIGSAGN